MADRIYMTEVDVEIDGDAVFPDFDAADFEQVGSTSYERDERNEFAFTYRVLERKD